MIIGVGVDIIETSRIAKSIDDFGDKFLNRIFTKNEIAIADQKSNLKIKINYYAKRFAAKEAFSKATGLGIGRGFDFTDIEITNDENGKPEIKLSEKSKEFLKQHFGIADFKIDVSMSDTKDFAESFVILSRN